MTKSELSAKWSKYCDTDKLYDDIVNLLDYYGYVHKEHGVCTLLDEFFTNKEPLINLISTSKNYLGDLRIVTKKPFARSIERHEVEAAVRNIERIVNNSDMYQYVDENGKGLLDYLAVGQTLISVDALPTQEEQTEKTKLLRQFEYASRATQASRQRRHDFFDHMNTFRYTNYATLQNDIVITDSKKDIVIKAGTKTSRALNKVCHYYGIDTLHPTTAEVSEHGTPVIKTVYPYDKAFAAYADTVSELTRKLYFVISVNPLDYLTMSNGVNWNSCHRLGGGQWQGGTLSYMLDHTSMITYVVTDLEESVHNAPKVYRQMFHYDNGLFMQNRLYPQGNDGATNLYTKFRDLVVEEFNTLLKENGEWSVEFGSDPCYNHTNSIGAHYKDYHNNNSCALFYPKSCSDKVREHIMTVGHEGICVCCGKRYTAGGRINHRSSRECTEAE